METPLSILYTHRLHGELDRLPRLHNFIRRLRGEFAEGQVYLIDLGESCHPERWPCDVTEGRSTLIVLDAMGYHAASIEGLLTPQSKARLIDQIMLTLVDADNPLIEPRICFALKPPDALGERLWVDLRPAEASRLEGQHLRLAALESGQVGLVRLSAGQMIAQRYDMPPDTAPEPTISGTVDFVKAEARYFEKRRAEKDDTD